MRETGYGRVSEPNIKIQVTDKIINRKRCPFLPIWILLTFFDAVPGGRERERDR